MLDPFVPLLSTSLSSSHIKVRLHSLLCLGGVVRLPLPSLPSHIESIALNLFAILKKYARAGAASVGANRDLVLAAFKVIVLDSVFCMSVQCSAISRILACCGGCLGNDCDSEGLQAVFYEQE